MGGGASRDSVQGFDKVIRLMQHCCPQNVRVPVLPGLEVHTYMGPQDPAWMVHFIQNLGLEPILEPIFLCFWIDNPKKDHAPVWVLDSFDP
jgi:hypothetical protein